MAGITLNILNKHCDRVKLACIAQMVNVLQSVILTEGDKMVKTPTWHVFNMYKHHQGAELLESTLTDGGFYEAGEGKNVKKDNPAVTESVSVKDDVITITLNNCMLNEEKDVEILFSESADRKVVEALVVTSGDVHDHNTFDAPNKVAAADFKGYNENGRQINVKLPAASVVMLRVK